MNLFKQTYYQLSSLLPYRALTGTMKGSVLLPYHHAVSDTTLPHIRHLYPVKNIKQFRKDLEILLQHFEPVSAADVVAHTRGEKQLPPSSFLLSFDDGFREVHDIIAPELIAKGIPAVFFVCPAFLDNQKLFFRNAISLIIDYLEHEKDLRSFTGAASAVLESRFPLSGNRLKRALLAMKHADKDKITVLASLAGISLREFLDQQKPYMTIGQVKALAAKGFAIGAHSWDHPDYSALETNEQLDQTSRSALFVKEQFGQEFSLFAFPHSDCGAGADFFRKMDLTDSYIDLYFGVRNQRNETNNRVLHRFNAERPFPGFGKQLKGLLLLKQLRKLTGQDSVKR